MTKAFLSIKKMSTQLRVKSLERALKFYVDELGFEEEFRYEDFYVGLIKDGCALHLKVGKPPLSENDDERENLNLIFSVNHIDELHEKLSGTSVTIIQPLREMPYGKEFYIADPDGNRIGFVSERFV